MKNKGMFSIEKNMKWGKTSQNYKTLLFLKSIDLEKSFDGE